MPTVDQGFWAAIGMVVATFLNRLFKWAGPRTPRASQADRLETAQKRLDGEWQRVLDEVKEELEECRRDRKVERWRTALLIRAMQEAGIAVPDAALLDAVYDAMTDTFSVIDPNNS